MLEVEARLTARLDAQLNAKEALGARHNERLKAIENAMQEIRVASAISQDQHVCACACMLPNAIPEPTTSAGQA